METYLKEMYNNLNKSWSYQNSYNMVKHVSIKPPSDQSLLLDYIWFIQVKLTNSFNTKSLFNGFNIRVVVLMSTYEIHSI